MLKHASTFLLLVGYWLIYWFDYLTISHFLLFSHYQILIIILNQIIWCSACWLPFFSTYQLVSNEWSTVVLSFFWMVVFVLYQLTWWDVSTSCWICILWAVDSQWSFVNPSISHSQTHIPLDTKLHITMCSKTHIPCCIKWLPYTHSYVTAGVSKVA